MIFFLLICGYSYIYIYYNINLISDNKKIINLYYYARMYKVFSSIRYKKNNYMYIYKPNSDHNSDQADVGGIEGNSNKPLSFASVNMAFKLSSFGSVK